MIGGTITDAVQTQSCPLTSPSSAGFTGVLAGVAAFAAGVPAFAGVASSSSSSAGAPTCEHAAFDSNTGAISSCPTKVDHVALPRERAHTWLVGLPK